MIYIQCFQQRQSQCPTLSLLDTGQQGLQLHIVPGPPGKFQAHKITLGKELMSTYLKLHIGNNVENPENRKTLPKWDNLLHMVILGEYFTTFYLCG